jgi:tetratricopeptide (TPR) repeat protein
MGRHVRQLDRRDTGSTASAPIHRAAFKPAADPRLAIRKRVLRDRVACCAVSALLVATVALVYAQTINYGFVNLDDEGYVAKNPHLRGGLTADALIWAFTTNRQMNWHPLTWLSLLLDAQFYGTTWAGGFHLTNVLLHAANAVLLFLLLRWTTGRLWPSALVAALFAAHPARVESVAWITERKDVLSGFFGLLTLWAYVWYTRAPDIVRYFLVVLALALGLLSKSTLVTWPFVFLLLDYWPLRRPFGWRLLLEKAPLLLAAAGCSAVTFLVQRASGAVFSLVSVPVPARFARAALAYLSYLRISVWPVNLTLYPIPKAGGGWSAAAAVGVLALLTAGAIWAARRGQRWLVVGWFWFLGTFVPTIGLVQVGAQVLADRFLYLPQIGLWIAVAWTAAAGVISRPRHPGASAAAAALVLALFTVAAWRQAACWRNSETLWRHSLACDEQNALAHCCLGMALRERHRDDLAEEQVRDAIRADPDYSMAYSLLGWWLEEKGNLDEAIQCYTKAIALNGNMPEAENKLGNALREKGDFKGAELHLDKALAMLDDYAEAYVSLAMLREQEGKDDEAVNLCRAALALDPGLAEAHFLLASSAARRGNLAEAAEHFNTAMTINPRLPETCLEMGLNLLRQGKHKAALSLLQAGVAYQSSDVRALEITAQLLATDPDPAVRNGKEALELALRAVELAGGRDAETLNTLAAAYAEAGQFPEAVRTATTAHDLAAAAGRSDLAANIQRRLDLFRAGKAFHEGKW